MSSKTCTACGAPLAADATSCKYCGETFAVNPPPGQAQYQQPPYQQPPPYQMRPTVGRTGKSKIAAGLLAIFLGGLGVHKFYLGKTGMGILYLCLSLFGFILFCIPTIVVGIIAFVEGIIYLTMSDEAFVAKYDS